MAGYGQYLVDGKDLGELTIPVVEIALLESAQIKKLNTSNIANITLWPNGKITLHSALKHEFSHIAFSKSTKTFGKLPTSQVGCTYGKVSIPCPIIN